MTSWFVMKDSLHFDEGPLQIDSDDEEEEIKDCLIFVY
jgi:hypothetical protein